VGGVDVIHVKGYIG